MRCKGCERSPDETACVECPKFCVQHQKMHASFPDNKTVCRDCVDETVNKLGDKVGTAWAMTLLEVEEKDPEKFAEVSNSVMAYLTEVKKGKKRAKLTNVDMVGMLISPRGAIVVEPIVTYAKLHEIRLEDAILKSIENPEEIFLVVKSN